MLDHSHIAMVMAIDRLHDRLKPNLPEEMKRRDPNEPGRAIKEAYEDRIAREVTLHFNRQAKQLRSYFKEIYADRKAIITPDDALRDEKFAAALMLLYVNMGQHAVELFIESVAIGVDVGTVSVTALDTARRYVGELITRIDDTTRKAVQEAVATFADTPGMTVGQLTELLPFSETRSRMIAVTETTNLYAGIEHDLGLSLKEQYPDVRVVKTWFTNNDDRVCPVCGPLHAVTVDVGELFPGGYEKPAAHPNCRCWHSVRTVIE